MDALPYPQAHWEAMVAHLRQQAASEGLEMTELRSVANTHRALVTSAYVQTEEPERFPDFHHNLFKGYFGEGRNIADPTVLREIAREKLLLRFVSNHSFRFFAWYPIVLGGVLLAYYLAPG